MWVSPNHPNPPRSTATNPPEEKGQRLLTLPRGDGSELRVTRDEYQGHPYIGIRVWEPGNDRVMYPTKRGVSIRMGELADVAQALGQLAGRPSAPAPPIGDGTVKYVPRPRDRKGPPRGPYPPVIPITGRIGDVNFDEFAE